MNLSISSKMVLLLLATGLVPTLIVGFVATDVMKAELQSQITKSLDAGAEESYRVLLCYFSSIRGRTADFSSDIFIRDSLAKAAEGDAQAAEELSRYLIGNKQPLDGSIAGILVTDINGTVVAATSQSELGRKADVRVNGTALLVPLRETGRFGLNESFMVAVPLTDQETGMRLGTLINFFSTGKAGGAMAAPAGSGTQGTLESYVTDGRGLMFIHQGPGHYPDMTAYTEPVRACTEEGRQTAGTYTNYAGRKVLGVSRCMPEYGLVVLAEVSEAEALGAINRVYFLLGTATLFFALTIILSGLVSASLVTGPIRELTEVVESISIGALDVKISPALMEGGDEIGRLARAFDRTLVSLKLAMRRIPPRR